MVSPRLTKKESEKLKLFIDQTAIFSIAKEKDIDPRMVRYILDAKYGDRHGVIELLIKAAKNNKGSISRRQKTVSKL